MHLSGNAIPVARFNVVITGLDPCRVLKQALSKLPKALQDASASSSAHPAEHTFAADSALQLALLSCACELVSFLLVDPQQLFPAACRRMASSKLMLEMWEAVQLCMQHLRDPTTPAAVLQYLAFMRMRILDEYALTPGSTIYDAMLNGPQTDGKLYGQVCSRDLSYRPLRGPGC